MADLPAAVPFPHDIPQKPFGNFRGFFLETSLKGNLGCLSSALIIQAAVRSIDGKSECWVSRGDRSMNL